MPWRPVAVTEYNSLTAELLVGEYFQIRLQKISIFVISHKCEIKENGDEHRDEGQENGTDPNDHKQYDRSKNSPKPPSIFD
jgi:hypothetical protein